MDYSSILTEARWTIIKEISKNELSATDIAAKLKTTTANISQQIRLLEAYGLIKKRRKIISKTAGKPKTTYILAKEMIEATVITKGYCNRKSFDLNTIQKFMLNTWMNLKQEEAECVQRFIIPSDDLLNKCQAIGIIKTNSDEIELLLITEKEHLESIRKEFSNQRISNHQNITKKIVCWTHTIEEITSGLFSKEQYFIELTKDIKPLLDNKDYLGEIRGLKHE